jgi:hypothetical protein
VGDSKAREVVPPTDLHQFEVVALAGGTDTLGLVGRRDEPFALPVADAGDADNANSSA